VTPVRCEDVRDDIDAYAIGALDADEAAALEAHLFGCANCRALLDAAREAGGAVALASPLVAAPAALKARIMASASVLSTERARRRPPLRGWWPAAAAAALIAVSAGGLTWGALMQREANDLRGDNRAAVASETAVAQQFALARDGQASAAAWQDGMVAIASAGDLKGTDMAATVLAPGAQGRYVWSANARLGALLATGMPALPAGKTYQFWFVYGNKWEGAGTCTTSGGRAQLIVHRSKDDSDPGPLKGFAVTIEPSAGSPARTGPMVLESSGIN
jgi:anti-sigma factor RsiW